MLLQKQTASSRDVNFVCSQHGHGVINIGRECQREANAVRLQNIESVKGVRNLKRMRTIELIPDKS